MLSYAKHGKFLAPIQAARPKGAREKAPFLSQRRHGGLCSALEWIMGEFSAQCGRGRCVEVKENLRRVAQPITVAEPACRAIYTTCGKQRSSLKRNGFRLNRYFALAHCLSMIFSENRFPLFGIML